MEKHYPSIPKFHLRHEELTFKTLNGTEKRWRECVKEADLLNHRDFLEKFPDCVEIQNDKLIWKSELHMFAVTLPLIRSFNNGNNVEYSVVSWGSLVMLWNVYANMYQDTYLPNLVEGSVEAFNLKVSLYKEMLEILSRHTPIPSKLAAISNPHPWSTKLKLQDAQNKAQRTCMIWEQEFATRMTYEEFMEWVHKSLTFAFSLQNIG